MLCDAATVEKQLSQFLISDSYRLVLNDVDALPLAIPGRGIKCGHRELAGPFVGRCQTCLVGLRAWRRERKEEE